MFCDTCVLSKTLYFECFRPFRICGRVAKTKRIPQEEATPQKTLYFTGVFVPSGFVIAQNAGAPQGPVGYYYYNYYYYYYYYYYYFYHYHYHCYYYCYYYYFDYYYPVSYTHLTLPTKA